MKKTIWTLAAISIFSLAACKQKESNTEGGSTATTSATTPSTTATSAKVSCNSVEKPNDGDPVLVKTCAYKNYQSISEGIPDEQGRYSYIYTLQEKQSDGSYKKIKNADLFNAEGGQLLADLNTKFEKDFDNAAKEAPDCFEGLEFRRFDWEQIGITFDDDVIRFSVNFNLDGPCMSMDGTDAAFTLADMQKYLK